VWEPHTRCQHQSRPRTCKESLQKTEDEHGLILDQALQRHTILFGFGRREIHSSEWRKPSEVSLRLRVGVVIHGGPSRSGSKVF